MKDLTKQEYDKAQYVITCGYRKRVYKYLLDSSAYPQEIVDNVKGIKDEVRASRALRELEEQNIVNSKDVDSYKVYRLNPGGKKIKDIVERLS